MVVLCGYPPGRRLRQGRIGFQGFVKHFDLPPFLVDCRKFDLMPNWCSVQPVNRRFGRDAETQRPRMATRIGFDMFAVGAMADPQVSGFRGEYSRGIGVPFLGLDSSNRKRPSGERPDGPSNRKR